MKSVLSFLIITLTLVACQSSTKTKGKTENTSTSAKTKIYKAEDLIKGEFIYVDSSAVLKGSDFIYGVVLNDKAQELIKKTNALKTDQYDMFPVILTGEIIEKNSKDTWQQWLEIKDIVEVNAPKSNQIQLQTQ